MVAPLGKHQLCLLATMASPFNILIVPDPIAKGLIKRGLLEERPHPRKKGEGCFATTPLGLRVLADALERGDLEQFFDQKFERDRVRIYLDGGKAA